MNKKSIIGIIVAIAVIIVIISMTSYLNMSGTAISSVNTNQTPIPTNNTINTPAEPIKTAGRHLSLELNESMGVKANP